MTFKDIDLTGLRDRMKKLDGAHLKTGIQQGSAHLEKAIYTNFGTERIPEAPVISEFGNTHRGELEKLSEKAVKPVIVNKKDPRAALEGMGKQATKAMQKALEDCDTPPNAPSTIAKKGFDDRWRDTGDTIADVRHKLEGI